MKTLLIIGSGSFLGGILRFTLNRLIQTKVPTVFPFGTLAVNLIGCLAIGLLFGLAERIDPPPAWRFFLFSGLFGGFTTFSAFSVESIVLLREGQLLYTGTYVLLSVLVGLFATYAGMAVTRFF